MLSSIDCPIHEVVGVYIICMSYSDTHFCKSSLYVSVMNI